MLPLSQLKSQIPSLSISTFILGRPSPVVSQFFWQFVPLPTGLDKVPSLFTQLKLHVPVPYTSIFVSGIPSPFVSILKSALPSLS